MGDFPSAAFWNWEKRSTDWFNLATGEALAEYNSSPAMRELVAGVESQREKRADPHLSASTGGIAHITVETRAPTHQSTHADTSPDRADANGEIAAEIRRLKFVVEFRLNAIDGAILTGSMTGSMA